jgi:hypothetical protein
MRPDAHYLPLTASRNDWITVFLFPPITDHRSPITELAIHRGIIRGGAKWVSSVLIGIAWLAVLFSFRA